MITKPIDCTCGCPAQVHYRVNGRSEARCTDEGCLYHFYGNIGGTHGDAIQEWNDAVDKRKHLLK